MEGFSGLVHGRISCMTHEQVSGILPRGGTILGSSRFNPYRDEKSIAATRETIKKLGLETLIVIGGDGTLGIALDLHAKENIPVIGIPKTIDNDVFGTDRCIGFLTAVQTAVDAIDRLHTTAESHNFVMVVELMGRHCGYLAAFSGIAGGADYLLVPEKATPVSTLLQTITERQNRCLTTHIIRILLRFGNQHKI